MMELCEIFGNETPLEPINQRGISQSQTYVPEERLPESIAEPANQHQMRKAQQFRRITKQSVVHGNFAEHRNAGGTRYSIAQPQISTESTNDQGQQTNIQGTRRIAKQPVVHGKVAEQRKAGGTRYSTIHPQISAHCTETKANKEKAR